MRLGTREGGEAEKQLGGRLREAHCVWTVGRGASEASSEARPIGSPLATCRFEAELQALGAC